MINYLFIQETVDFKTDQLMLIKLNYLHRTYDIAFSYNFFQFNY